MKEKIKDFLIKYYNILVNPNNWSFKFLVGTILLFSVILESPLYYIYARHGDIVGLLITYSISLCPITLLLIIVKMRYED